MNARARETLDLLRRVYQFLVDAKLEGPLAPDAPQVRAVATLVERLTAHAVTQDETVRQRRVAVETRTKVMRELRRVYIVPLVTQGRVLFADRLSDPVIAAALTLPKAYLEPNALVASARALANVLENHAARFVAVGFASDFVTQLRAMADRVERSAGQRRVAVQQRVAATVAAAADAREGRRLVMVIDRLMRDALRDDAAQWAVWRNLIRIPKRPKRKEEGAEGAAGGVAGTPAGAAATPALPSTPEVTVTKAA